MLRIATFVALMALATAAPQAGYGYGAPAPVVHVPVAHPVVKEVPKPYAYQYGVADDYSGAKFNSQETQDANGVVGGSYSVALPDGRIQTVTYTADHVNGFVADVKYEGTAVYPDLPKVVAAPLPGYHA